MICETTGSLPNPGGVLQQRHGHILRLEAVYSAKGKWVEDQMKEKK